MLDLMSLSPVARKIWVKKKWDEYQQTRLAEVIKRSLKVYNTPQDEKFDGRVDKAKWHSTVNKKVNYLLARPPLATGAQDELTALLPLLEETATQFYLRGSLVWIVQGDGVSLVPQPMILNDALVLYADENREEPIAYVRRYADMEVDDAGSEKTIEYFECYYGMEDNAVTRDTYCYSVDDRDKVAERLEGVSFITLGKTGDAPLFAYLETLLAAFDHILNHQDRTTAKNTKPLVEVRGYSGSSDADLEDAIDNRSLAKVDGNGGVTIHTRQMDSASIDIWVKRLLQEYNEAACIVGKDNEMQFAQSGKAMDRLFVDMENDARKLAHTLETALREYFAIIGKPDVDIVWNTDRPVDDAATIQSISLSRGIISDRTLLEQHPWVDDVDEELRRLQQQNTNGMQDLMNMEEEE